MALEFIRLSDSHQIDAHAPGIASLIYESGPTFFCALFGDERTAVNVLAQWVRRGTSEFSGTRATLALESGTPAGMFIALAGAETTACRRSDLLALMQQARGDRSELVKKLKALGELTAPVLPDDYYIRTVAVDARQRRRGLGRAIVEHAMDAGRAAGFRAFRLDVDADNEAALRLYRTLGLKQIAEGAAPDYGLRMFSMRRED